MVRSKCFITICENVFNLDVINIQLSTSMLPVQIGNCSRIAVYMCPQYVHIHSDDHSEAEYLL